MKRSLVLILIVVALSLSAAFARATPPSGVASGTVLARGTAAETLVIGTPRTTTVTKKVKIRVARKVVIKRVKVQVESVQPLMTCGGSNACETVGSAGHHQPEWSHRLAHASRPNVRGDRTGRRDALPL